MLIILEIFDFYCTIFQSAKIWKFISLNPEITLFSKSNSWNFHARIPTWFGSVTAKTFIQCRFVRNLKLLNISVSDVSQSGGLTYSWGDDGFFKFRWAKLTRSNAEKRTYKNIFLWEPDGKVSPTHLSSEWDKKKKRNPLKISWREVRKTTAWLCLWFCDQTAFGLW